MELLAYIGINLTMLVVFAILNSRKKRIRLKGIVFSQLDLHSVVKEFMPSNRDLARRKPSQINNRAKENTIRFVTTPEQKVYWVKDRVFYSVDLIDGEFNPSDAVPISTENLSKNDMDKLLYILDMLKDKE
jgi:hypothetical protein